MRTNFSLRFAVGAVLCVVAVVVYLIHEPPRVGETWNLWFFGHVFKETGAFMTPGRSPLYAVYTSVFLPLGYPLGPMVARLLDTAFIFSGLFVLFRPFVGRGLGLVCALIWIPGMLQLGSPISGLALASLFWAYILRRGPGSRFRLSLSYAFLILAGMLRPNYMLLVPVIFPYDAVRFIRCSGITGFLPAVRPRMSDWPLALAFGVSILFSVNQSDHRWNNGWVTDTTWFGNQSPSLTVASQLFTLVQWVIIDKYDGDYENHDIYFVVKEEFGEVDSLFDLFARYDLYLGLLYNNKQILYTITMHTDIGRLLYRGAVAAGSHKFAYPVFFALLLVGLIGFYRSQTDNDEKTRYIEFAATIIFLTVPILFTTPSGRYTMFYIPLFAASGLWYGRQLVQRAAFLEKSAPRIWGVAKPVLVIVPFLLFSNGVSRATVSLSDVWNPASWQRPNLVNLEITEKQLADITDKISDCRGIMTNDHHTFLATFSNIPNHRFFPLYEIPPFGRYNEGDYDGLRPDRIDCAIIIRKRLEPGGSSFVTQRSRYENFLAPYIDVLRSMGAKTYEIDIDGGTDVVILR